MATPLTVEFFVLRGDANGDRHVNLSDFNVLASRFGGTVAPQASAASTSPFGTSSIGEGDGDEPTEDVLA